jgi:predicted flavoprotein YhiN
MFILGSMNLPADLSLACLEKGQRNRIVDGFTGYPFPVQTMGGYKEAMVTAGGVNRTEVNASTMESKMIPGLYFTGELLDVDGDSGGYNLQFAFSSGYLAAKAISEQNKNRNR